MIGDDILLSEDDKTIIRWFKVICKTYDTCFDWNWM